MSIIDLMLLLRPTFHPPASPSASPPTRRPSPSCDHYKGACQDRRQPIGHALRVPLWRQHLKIRLLRFDNPFVEQRPKCWFLQPKKKDFSWTNKVRWFVKDRINLKKKKSVLLRGSVIWFHGKLKWRKLTHHIILLLLVFFFSIILTCGNLNSHRTAFGTAFKMFTHILKVGGSIL